MKNLCKVQYRKAAISACALFYASIITTYILLIAKPSWYLYLYSTLNVSRNVAIGAVWNSFVLIFNVFLTVGLVLEIPCLMFIWVAGNIILWLCHNVVLIIATLRPGDLIIRKAYLLVIQSVWLVLIWNVISFWKEVSDDIVDENEVPWKTTRRTRFITSFKRRTQFARKSRHTLEKTGTRLNINIERISPDASASSPMVEMKPAASSMFVAENILGSKSSTTIATKSKAWSSLNLYMV